MSKSIFSQKKLLSWILAFIIAVSNIITAYAVEPPIPGTADTAVSKEAFNIEESASAYISNETVIDIFSFNDFHGTVDKSASGSNPGADRFVAIIEELKKENPDNTVILSAGDSYQGSPLSNIFMGEPVSEMIKYLGVKYSALGNHEFDWGADKIGKFAEDGDITFLAANIFLKGTNNQPDFCEPYAVIEAGGKKIGIIGLTTVDTPSLVKSEYVEGFEFKEPGPWLTDLVSDLKINQGCDAVIALAHMGAGLSDGVVTGEASRLANTCQTFDAIISGHTHAVVEGTANGIPVVQGNYNGRGLGRLTLVFDDDGLVSVTPKAYNQNNMNSADILPNDPLAVNEDIKEIIAWYRVEVQDYFNEVVGTFGVQISNKTERDAWATKVVNDYITRETGESYILVQNAGGWRSTDPYDYTPEKEVTVGYLYTLMPFDNEIVLLEMRGKDILYMLNDANPPLISVPCVDGAYNENGKWYIKGTNKEIDPDEVYPVACNDFMFTGGDNYPFPGNSFGNAAGVEVIGPHKFMGVPLRDAMIIELKYRMNQPSVTPTPTDTVTPTPTDTPTESPYTPVTGRYRTSPAQPPTEIPPTPTPVPISPTTGYSDIIAVAKPIADLLYSLKLFVGTGLDTAGNPVFELNRPPTRMEALAILIRLLGLQSTAYAYEGVNPFTDTPAWGDRIAAYAYANGITVGVNEAHTLFNANAPVTYQEFTAFLLRVLGYFEKNGDFAYADTLSKAVAVNLYSIGEVQAISNLEAYIRAGVVINMADALLTPIKGSDARLIDQLVETGAISSQAADLFVDKAKQVYSK